MTMHVWLLVLAFQLVLKRVSIVVTTVYSGLAGPQASSSGSLMFVFPLTDTRTTVSSVYVDLCYCIN